MTAVPKQLLKDLQRALWLNSPPHYFVSVIATKDTVQFDVRKGEEYIVYSLDVEELKNCTDLEEFTAAKVKDAIEKLEKHISKNGKCESENEKNELSEKETLQQELQIAIQNEEYEEAARLRDKINAI